LSRAAFSGAGPNGAGKTSTIRRDRDHRSGFRANQPVWQTICAQEPEQVGYLPEERGLSKKMKISEQLVFLGELHGMTASDAKQQAVTWCKRLEIDAWMQKKVEELSKGSEKISSSPHCCRTTGLHHHG